MNSKDGQVLENALKVQLRRQGPWLIMRLYHPDGCRFSDQLAGRIPSEHKEATLEDRQASDHRHCCDSKRIRR